MAHFQNFTSLPPHEEQTFVVYEQRMADALRSGFTLGTICGAILLVAAIAVYLGVKPEHIDYTKDMNMSNLTKKDPALTAPAPAPVPTPAPVPAVAPGGTTDTGTAPAPSGTAPAPTPPAEAPAPK